MLYVRSLSDCKEKDMIPGKQKGVHLQPRLLESTITVKEALTHWDSNPPDKDAEVERIDHFDARGMRLVYGRGDHFSRHRTFNMDIWITRTGRLLMRCWSRCRDIDGCSFEIKGLDTSAIPQLGTKTGLHDSWVPGVVRNTYDEWIQAEF